MCLRAAASYVLLAAQNRVNSPIPDTGPLRSPVPRGFRLSQPGGCGLADDFLALFLFGYRLCGVYRRADEDCGRLGQLGRNLGKGFYPPHPSTSNAGASRSTGHAKKLDGVLPIRRVGASTYENVG